MKRILFLASLITLCASSFAQHTSNDRTPEKRFEKKLSVGITTNTDQPEDTWFMVGDSGTNKAMMPPRVSDTSSIAHPREGMFMYSLADKKYYYRDKFQWREFGGVSRDVNELQVSWNSGLIFDVSSGYYTIGNGIYYYAGGQITLPAADPSLPRKDIIYADASGVHSRQGTPAADPAKPQVDISIEKELTHVDIPAGATTPANITSITLWDGEGSDLITGTTTGSVTFNNTTQAQHGTHSTFVATGGLAGTQQIAYNAATVYSVGDWDHIKLYVRLGTALAGSRSPDISLLNGSTVVTDVHPMTDFGLNRGLINQWQTIIIPLAAFHYINTTSFTGIRIGRFNNTIGNFWIDNISIQAGVTIVQSTNAAWGGITGLINKQVDLRDSLRTRIIATYIKPGTDSVFDKLYDNSLRFSHVRGSSGGTAITVDKSLNGVRYRKSNFTNLSDFTATGGTFGTSGGKITVSAGAGDYNNKLALNYWTGSENWQMGSKVTISSVGTNGIALGMAGVADYIVWYRPFDSLIRIQSLFSTSIYFNNLSSKVPLANGDQVEFIVDRGVNVVGVSIRNITQNKQATTTGYTHFLNLGIDQLPPTLGQPTIFNVGGTMTVDSFGFTDKQTVHSDLLAIVDSKGTGMWGGSYLNRAAAQLQQKYGIQVSVWGGTNTRASDWQNATPELSTLSPKIAIMFPPSNSARNGVSAATYQAQYDSVERVIQASGAKVFHMSSLYEGTCVQCFNMFPNWDNWLISQYGASRIINAYNASKQAGVLLSDSIHLSDYGQDRAIVQPILSLDSIKTLTARSLTPIQPIIEYKRGVFVLRSQENKDSASVLRWGESENPAFPQLIRNGSGLSLMNGNATLFSDLTLGTVYSNTGLWIGGSFTPQVGGNLRYSGIFYIDNVQPGSTWGDIYIRGNNVQLYSGNLLTLTTTADRKVGIAAVTSPTDYLHGQAATANGATLRIPDALGTSFTRYEGQIWKSSDDLKFYNTADNTFLVTPSVNTVSPTSPNRTITVSIGGTTYYIAAKTTND